jgi:hypothetical protein
VRNDNWFQERYQMLSSAKSCRVNETRLQSPTSFIKCLGSDDRDIRSTSALVINFGRLTHFDFNTYAVSCMPFNSAESCGLDAHLAAVVVVVVKSDSA